MNVLVGADGPCKTNADCDADELWVNGGFSPVSLAMWERGL